MARRSRWKRWRYVTAGGSLVTFLAALLVLWRQGQDPLRSLAVAAGLAVASVAIYLVRWWLHGSHMRETGWEW